MNEVKKKETSISHSGVRIITEGALMVALSAALSFLSLRLWPQGGSVDLVMIPIIVFSLRHGGVWGLIVCAIYGFIDCLLSGGVGYGWQAIILDYLIAYSLVGLAGFFPKKPVLATCVASAARLLMHIISGVVIWGEWMPEEFLGMSMSNVWFYSFLYNGTFMLGNAVIAIIVISILGKSTKLLTRV